MFATTADNKPTLDGNIRFTGMAIYWTMWAEAGVKIAESDEKQEASGTRANNSVAAAPAPDDTTLSAKKQYDKKKIIFGEHTWPAEENVSPLEGGL